MKISYAAQIGTAGLSSKEKSVRHSRGRNFDPIAFKIGTHLGLIKPQIKFKNKLCGANNFFCRSYRGQNFDSIFFIKLGKLADIIKDD